jgi:biotin synthase
MAKVEKRSLAAETAEVDRRRPSRQRQGRHRAFAWARPGAGRRKKILKQVTDMVAAVKALGLETCATLGMLKEGQAETTQSGRTGLLQPQPGYLAGVLRRGD